MMWAPSATKQEATRAKMLAVNGNLRKQGTISLMENSHQYALCFNYSEGSKWLNVDATQVTNEWDSKHKKVHCLGLKFMFSCLFMKF